MGIAPVVMDYESQEYRETVTRESVMLQHSAQRDHEQLMQEFQNNPDKNLLFYRFSYWSACPAGVQQSDLV